ncbi:MAG: FAD-dependent oxidoreductase [Planctomycetota bacterium]|jgi:phytoene dehydrogenase-like protein|nr:FAD-dependent oxidoreductase [Planctomycetota bacterium]
MLISSPAALNRDYQVVVVGAGIGGMTAAKRLADQGRKVLLLEAGPRLGGYLTWFRRPGHIFEVALHAFPWGVAKTFRKYWSQHLAERVVPLPRIRYENPEFSFTTDFSARDFDQILAKHFAVPPETSQAFFQACQNMDIHESPPETTRHFLERFFPGRLDVARFLLETVTYATGTNLDDPAKVYAIIFNNFTLKGTYTIMGGSDWLLAEMQRLLLEAGVDILLRTRVERIVTRQGRVCGVAAGGREIISPVVVSNANLLATGLDLLAEGELPPAFAQQLAEVPLSVSVAQVYLGLAPGERIPEIADILFASELPSYDAKALTAFPPRSASFSFYYPRHIHPESDSTEIVASVCADYADWDGLSPADYQAKKAALARQTLHLLSRHLPGIEAKLNHTEVATPKTLERYCGHRRGASFGTKYPGLAAAAELAKTVPGLFHCGAEGIVMSGWLGSANCGALAAGAADSYIDRLDRLG